MFGIEKDFIKEDVGMYLTYVNDSGFQVSLDHFSKFNTFE